MRTVFSLFLLSIALALPGFAQTKVRAAANPFQEADQLFTLGEDPGRDKQALAVIERELARDSNNYQWLWRAARAKYFVGDSLPKDNKLPYFEKGIEIAQQAIAREPNAVEGHFWLAVNYGGYSEAKGMFKALTTVKKIRAEMETVLRLNDRYQEGGAYLALGELDRQLPRLLGGSLERSINRLEQGLRIAPNNFEIKFALAASYEDAGRKDDARKQLLEITQKPARSGNDRHLQEKAKQKLGGR